jgi:hypothetical protein
VIENEEDEIVVYVNADERQALVVQGPCDIPGDHRPRGAVVDEWVSVSLATADADQLGELMEDGWRRLATRRAIAVWEARTIA